MPGFDPEAVLRHFYPEDTPLRRLLLRHSSQVRDMALRILDAPSCPLELDRELVSAEDFAEGMNKAAAQFADQVVKLLKAEMQSRAAAAKSTSAVAMLP